MESSGVANTLLSDYPELSRHVLSDVQHIRTIGGGTYGSVEEVAIPRYAAICAAKKIHAHIQTQEVSIKEFAKECQLMSSLRHPNVVQFYGIYFFPGSPLPSLVMERMLTSLHELLAPEKGTPSDAPKPLFPLSLKYSILHNVASGLAFLHNQDPPIIHRNLSAKNVLLNAGMVAKIADLAEARRVADLRIAAIMTKCQGAQYFLPPEASDKREWDGTIDSFSFGVLTIFAIGEDFPCEILPATYTDDNSGVLAPRTELERRSKYMDNVKAQIGGDHPLVALIEQCLKDRPADRPTIREVLEQLQKAGAGVKDEESKRILDLMKEKADLESENKAKDKELSQKEEDLQNHKAKEEELKEELSEKEKQWEKREAELVEAQEEIRRENQQLQEREADSNKTLAEAQQQLKEKEEALRLKETELAEAKQLHKANARSSAHTPHRPKAGIASATSPPSAGGGLNLTVLLNELAEVEDKWYQIGLCLGVSDETLDQIKKSYANPSDRLLHMLREYMKPTSWEDVIHALKKPAVKKTSLAERLHKQYISPSPVVVMSQADSSSNASAVKPEDFADFPEPELSVLVEVVGVNVQAKWRAVGLALKVEKAELDTIKKDKSSSVQDCMTEVFTRWRDGATSEYSWRHLAEVLCSHTVGKPGLLQNLHKSLTATYKKKE